jgi:hypothetical protein
MSLTESTTPRSNVLPFPKRRRKSSANKPVVSELVALPVAPATESDTALVIELRRMIPDLRRDDLLALREVVVALVARGR